MLKRQNYIVAIKLSIIIGTLLNLINNNDMILSGNWTTQRAVQAALTYTVPFFVSIYSSWKANKIKKSE